MKRDRFGRPPSVRNPQENHYAVHFNYARSFLAAGMAVLALAVLVGVGASCNAGTGKLMDHEVVLDESGRLQPWTPYKNIILGSMKYIKHCPTVPTDHGDDPWYLVTSELEEDGAFSATRTTGGNAYYAVETLRRYLRARMTGSDNTGSSAA